MMAADAAGLLDALSIRRAHVMGVSLGGYVAQTMAIERPELVAGLVLGCTYMTGDPEAIRMPATTLDLLTKREGTPEEIARRGLAAAFSAGYPGRCPEIFETLVRWRVEDPAPPHGYVAQLEAGMGFDERDRVGSIASRVLVLHGDGDAVVPVGRAPELQRAIPGSRLGILAGAGHLFFIEQAGRTAELVASFLREAR
jgi:pimeloyl-ACP methyl ester carboxylesterase